MYFVTKKQRDLKNLRLTRLEWCVGTYIESIRFTMSDGQVSPKFGRKSITNCCDLDSPITKIVAVHRERGLVSLEFFSESESLKIEGTGEVKHTDTVTLHQAESLI